jgi:hypothetical protein
MLFTIATAGAAEGLREASQEALLFEKRSKNFGALVTRCDAD